MAGRAPRPVTKTALAKERGCHRSQVTRATSPGGILAKAVLPGGRVDRGHPAVMNWMAMAVIGSDDAPTRPEESAKSTARAPTSKRKRGKSSTGKPTEPPDLSRDENGFFPGLYSYTHKQIADQFATFQAVADIVDLHHKTEQARKLWLSNELAEGNLIERDRVLVYAIGYFESAQKRILSDAPKTIALRAISMAKSGATAEEIELLCRDTLGAILAPARDSAVRALRRRKVRRETKPDEE